VSETSVHLRPPDDFEHADLSLALRSKLLEPSFKVKTTCAEVHRTIRMTFLVAPNNYLVKAGFKKLLRSVRACERARAFPGDAISMSSGLIGGAVIMR
jgi:hypothetical protein